MHNTTIDATDYIKFAAALQAAGEAAHNERRHQLALKHFRELRAVTGVAYLAEEIMELQLLDRYRDAQMLLDAATRDSHAGAESLLPGLLFAQAKQHYNLGEASLRERVGQQLGTSRSELITQQDVQWFADATRAHEWIHIDTQRAAREGPFGTTVAHGYLTLSLATPFVTELLGDAAVQHDRRDPAVEDSTCGGFDLPTTGQG